MTVKPGTNYLAGTDLVAILPASAEILSGRFWVAHAAERIADIG